ncbi:MAG: hypothetical protein J6B45_03090 [Clostridia bacterium]|nr:hypothetical protein [Clostridia bacterium]
MKKTLKSISIRMVAWLLAIAMVLLTGICFGIFPVSVSAAGENVTVNHPSDPVYVNYYYDVDDCDYTANSSTLHNEWSKFFDISLTCAGGYSRSGSAYVAKSGYPMQLKITGTPNYDAMHAGGTNTGNDGMHYYSYDGNGYVENHLVGSGLIIIEYLDSATDAILETQVYEGLWEKDLSVPLDLLLKYHSDEYRINVKLSYECYKYVDEKKHYWNITEETAVCLRVLTEPLPYDKSFEPSVASYYWIESDKANIEAVLEEPIRVRGVYYDTTDNPGIRLELYSHYLTINTVARDIFYEKQESPFNIWIASGTHHWWYRLENDSYIEINGEKSPLPANENGVYVLEPPVPKGAYINVKVCLNITFFYTYYEHAFGITTETANEERKCIVKYNINIPVSVSDTNQILLYDNVADDYSQTSLVLDGMVKETNTLAIVTSGQNKFTQRIERLQNNEWVSADVTESVKSAGEKLYILNSENPCEQYRVVLTDNQGKSRIETFYVIKDVEKLLELKVTNQQYNEYDTLPWVKELDDHKILCSVPELYEETVTSTPLENGGERVTKRVTIGNKADSGYLGTYYEFTYEFYIGAVDAPRLNSIKFQTNYYHVIPGNYSVEYNCKLYVFKYRDEALLFAESTTKDNYKKPSSLVQGIADKERFDLIADFMVCENATRQELIDRAGGNLEVVFVSSYYEAPIDEENIYLYGADFLYLSITDTVSVVFGQGENTVTFELQQDEELREIQMKEITKLLGYGEVQVTESFYDGTTLTYNVILLAD